MKILVTGANGFVGKNLVQFLKQNNDIEVLEYDVLSTDEELDNYCQICDFVVNLAGVNRTADNSQFYTGNLGVIEQVVNLLIKHNNNAPIIYSSSIQAENDSEYGKSKRLAEEFLLDYQNRTQNKVYIYRFANLFGKWSKPNYNSVIATFCHNVSRELPITINDRNVEINFVYIDDVIKEIFNAINGDATKDGDFYIVNPVYRKKLGAVADLIYSFKENRNSLNVINTADEFEKKLYSTYLSYMPEDGFEYCIKSNVDNRGSFTELLKSQTSGQVSVNIAKPNITKGNHWHNTKNEKFIVVKGEAIIRFRKPFEKEVIEYRVSGDDIKIVDIPCGYTHNITNVGNEDMVFIIWTNELFDKENPDTYYLEV